MLNLPSPNPDRPPIPFEDLKIVAAVGGSIGAATTTLHTLCEAYAYGMATRTPIYVGIAAGAFAMVVGVAAMWADARRGSR